MGKSPTIKWINIVIRSVISESTVQNLKPLATVKAGWITDLVWSLTSNTLAVAAETGVRLYIDSFGGDPALTFGDHEGHIKGVAISPKGDLICSVGSDMRVQLWSLQDGRAIHRQSLMGHTHAVSGVAFSPDGQTVATASADKTVKLWDAASASLRATLDGHTDEVAAVGFALDGSVLVSGGWDATVRLWDVGNETSGMVIGQHDDWIRDLAVNPPGTMIASAGKDGTVRLWDVYGERCYSIVQAHAGGVDSVAFSPDGKLLASGGRDNVARLWNVGYLLEHEQVNADAAIKNLSIHEKPVLAVAFNASGTLVATGGGDNTVHLWAVD